MPSNLVSLLMYMLTIFGQFKFISHSKFTCSRKYTCTSTHEHYCTSHAMCNLNLQARNYGPWFSSLVSYLRAYHGVRYYLLTYVRQYETLARHYLCISFLACPWVCLHNAAGQWEITQRTHRAQYECIRTDHPLHCAGRPPVQAGLGASENRCRTIWRHFDSFVRSWSDAENVVVR